MEIKNKRVLLGFVEIAGYYAALQAGFRENGFVCDFYTYENHPFSYGRSSRSRLCGVIRSLVMLQKRLTSTSLGSKFVKLILISARLPFQLLFMLATSFRYDTFIFGFCSSFVYPLPPNLSKIAFWELYWLRLLRKQIIFVMHGSDVRPPFMDGTFQDLPIHELARLNNSRRQLVYRVEKFATYIVCDAAYAAYFTKPLINRSYIMCPAMPIQARLPAHELSRHREYLTIVHAPSAPKLKGSDTIRAAITSIQSGGIKIKYLEIVKQPNSKVIEVIRNADLVIDQLYSDIPLPGLASESAFIGKPVIMGMYDKNFVLGSLRKEARPPVYYVKPTNLLPTLQRILRRGKRKLASRGLSMKRFALNNITPKVVASRFIDLIAGEIPDYWWYDPKTYDYTYGCVISRERLDSIISQLINNYGISALCMDDKPQYLRKVLKHIEG